MASVKGTRGLEIVLNSDRIGRLKKYTDWIRARRDNSFNTTLTDYWKHHSNIINVKFNGDSVFLTGESGFYFPRELNLLNRLRYFARLLPARLSYSIFTACRFFFSKPIDFLSAYSDAYENIWRLDPVTRRGSSSQGLNFEKLKNEKLNFRTIKGMKEKWPSAKTNILAEMTIKAYFYLQLMESNITKLAGLTVCEIGCGTGNLATLLHYHFNTKLFLVDLPKTLLFSFSYLSSVVPNAKILLPNEIEAGNFELRSPLKMMM